MEKELNEMKKKQWKRNSGGKVRKYKLKNNEFTSNIRTLKLMLCLVYAFYIPSLIWYSQCCCHIVFSGFCWNVEQIKFFFHLFLDRILPSLVLYGYNFITSWFSFSPQHLIWWYRLYIYNNLANIARFSHNNSSDTTCVSL